ncbi:MAG: sulfatase-like hydrolase/transferase [Chloroflexota bacterium]
MGYSRPNIVFIFTDQQRWDTLGCYGNERDLTPNLDEMAREGVRFDQAFTAQPVCGPARCCLQTGLYPTSVGCFRNGIPLPLDTTTLAHRFKGVGYEVAYIGKWHLAGTRDEPVPEERRGGWTDFWLGADLLEFTSSPYGGGYYDANNELIPFDGYRVDSQTDHVLEYLRNREREEPFFLFVSYLEPHHQNDQNRYVAPKGYAKRYADYDPPKDLVGHEGDWQENLADYYGICANLDENVGRIRKTLEELDLTENTIVFYTSDHGSHFRTRNSEYKRSCHEASIHIPMIAWGPGFDRGSVVHDLVSLVDLPPTLLHVGGIQIPDEFHGRSLISLIEGKAEKWPEEVFVQISESQVGRAVRTKRWKYCVDAPDADGWDDPDSEVYEEQYLYDLEVDPHEQNNLVGDPRYRATADELAEILVRRMVAAGEEAPRIIQK